MASINVRKTLVVRNIEQAAAWLELDGQLSDGFWENDRPYDHWEPWCAATVVVADPGQPVGRDFMARRTAYNFTSPELVDVVGLRMLALVRIARHVQPSTGYVKSLKPRARLAIAQILEHAPECETGRIDWTQNWNDKSAQLATYGVTPADVDKALADESYGMVDLVKDLRDLKAIVKEVL